MTKMNNYKKFTTLKNSVLIVGINDPNNKYLILHGETHTSM